MTISDDVIEVMSEANAMKQRYHTIIKPRPDGSFVGWVEEIPGTVSRGASIDECREHLREALALIIEAHRAEARLFLDDTCLEEPVELEIPDFEHAGLSR